MRVSCGGARVAGREAARGAKPAAASVVSEAAGALAALNRVVYASIWDKLVCWFGYCSKWVSSIQAKSIVKQKPCDPCCLTRLKWRGRSGEDESGQGEAGGGERVCGDHFGLWGRGLRPLLTLQSERVEEHCLRC